MSASATLLLARSRTLRAGETVPSPCLSVCRMTPDRRLCEGCFRTLDEIAAWSTMSDEDKRDVWRAIAQRAAT
ncbi:DUF1289 domain-containing protein [Ramlibacter sp.]|uniref:DUF1289 domain-containing protein n=1 Tax=Ramlibacter sp. TaxID=1917967 RepID=UPI003D0A7DA0